MEKKIRKNVDSVCFLNQYCTTLTSSHRKLEKIYPSLLWIKFFLEGRQIIAPLLWTGFLKRRQMKCYFVPANWKPQPTYLMDLKWFSLNPFLFSSVTCSSYQIVRNVFPQAQWLTESCCQLWNADVNFTLKFFSLFDIFIQNMSLSLLRL